MSWKIDPAHSEITFSVRHMMISNVRGRFEKFDGAVDFNMDDPTRSSVEVSIDANSINTRDAQRDGHLRSADFLAVEEYPVLAFKSTRLEKVNDATGRIYGDLTIRGVTRPVVLDTEMNGILKNPWGKTAVGFSASTQINRKDWGLNWNVALEAGGWLVSEEISINIELELVQQVEQEPAAQA